MAGRDAPAGAAEHQLHLCRSGRKYRLRLQRPVSGAKAGLQLERRPARRPFRSHLAPLPPFSREPQLWNPKSGFVFNSNNTPFQATAADDNLKPKDFPAWMGIHTNMTNRAYRAEETFGADNAIGAEDFRNYKFDLFYSSASELAEEISEVLQVRPGNDADLKKAQA